MRQHELTPNTLHSSQCKDKKRLIQLNKVYNAFFDTPCTMLMAARSSGVERASVCRHVHTLKKQNRIAVLKRDHCPITRHRAGYYCTDPTKFPPTPKQLNLF